MRSRKMISMAAIMFSAATLLWPTGASASVDVTVLTRVPAQSVSDSEEQKYAEASCPAGSRVVGGGGTVNDGGTRKVMLTSLAPLHRGPVHGDIFAVAARNIDPQFAGSWSVTAYAICASGQIPKNLAVYEYPGQETASQFKSEAMARPAGQRALSAGAWTDRTSTPRAGLQLVRTSGPRDIGRGTARVSQPGQGAWWLIPRVVCAESVPGFDPPVSKVVAGADGSVACPPGKKVYGAGGGGSLTDSGNSYLRSVTVSNDLREVRVSMTGQPVGGMVIQAICGPAS